MKCRMLASMVFLTTFGWSAGAHAQTSFLINNVNTGGRWTVDIDGLGANWSNEFWDAQSNSWVGVQSTDRGPTDNATYRLTRMSITSYKMVLFYDNGKPTVTALVIWNPNDRDKIEWVVTNSVSLHRQY